MLTLNYPWLLGLLPIPLLIYWLLPPAKQTPSNSLRAPFLQRLHKLPQSAVAKPSKRRLLLVLITWLCLLLAATDPTWLGEPVYLPQSGRDIMLVIDISGSMKIQDMELGGHLVDRLSAVQAVADDFIRKRKGDRIGLIIFGSKAYLQTPLTYDRQTVRQMLADSSIGLAGTQTAIGDALGLGLKHLLPSARDSRVMILLTDGVNNAGKLEALAVAQAAKQEGIKIHTIGMGADVRQIHTLFGTRTIQGQADLDIENLTNIAKQTGGLFFRAQDTQSLQKIYSTLNELHPVQTDKQIWRPQRHLYWCLLLLALACNLVLLNRYLVWPVLRIRGLRERQA